MLGNSAIAYPDVFMSLQVDQVRTRHCTKDNTGVWASIENNGGGCCRPLQ